MITITNISDVKKLAIGEHFLLGRYAQYPIEWIKVKEDTAIATCVLEKMAFGEENDYEISRIRIWCNELAEKTGLAKDTIYVPTKKLLRKWFVKDNKRRCDYSKSLKERKEEHGSASYWTSEPCYGGRFVNIVECSGMFGEYDAENSEIGVRPALKLNNVRQQIAKHKEICNRLNDTYKKKNTDYGDLCGARFGEIEAITAITRIGDKFNQFKSLAIKENDEEIDESMKDILLELANYCIMTVMGIEMSE